MGLKVRKLIGGKALVGSELEPGKKYVLSVQVQKENGDPAQGCAVEVKDEAGDQVAKTDDHGQALLNVTYNSDGFVGHVKINCGADGSYVQNYSTSLETGWGFLHSNVIKVIAAGLSKSAVKSALGRTENEKVMLTAELSNGEVRVLDQSGQVQRTVPLSGQLSASVEATPDPNIAKLTLERLGPDNGYFRICSGPPSFLSMNVETGEINGELHSEQLAREPYLYDAKVHGVQCGDAGELVLFAHGRTRRA